MTDDIISIEQPKRTLQQMQVEYHQMCIRMGEMTYEIFAHEKAVEQNHQAIQKMEETITNKKLDLKALKQQVHKLNLEAAEMKKKEEAEAVAAKMEGKEIECKSE